MKASRRKPSPLLYIGIISTVMCTNPACALSPPLPPLAPTDFSLGLALQGAQTAMAECNKINEKVAVAVVDRAEHVRVLLVSDGYDRDWLGFVQGEARVVLKTGMSSGDYGNSFNKDFGKMAATITADRIEQGTPGNTPIVMRVTPGAVPIMKDGKLVGAVAVAGSRGPSMHGYEFLGPVEPCATAGRTVIETGIKSGR